MFIIVRRVLKVAKNSGWEFCCLTLLELHDADQSMLTTGNTARILAATSDFRVNGFAA